VKAGRNGQRWQTTGGDIGHVTALTGYTGAFYDFILSHHWMTITDAEFLGALTILWQTAQV